MVRAEMVRLHDVHNVLGYALRLSVKERLGPESSWAQVEDEVKKLLRMATAELVA